MSTPTTEAKVEEFAGIPKNRFVAVTIFALIIAIINMIGSNFTAPIFYATAMYALSFSINTFFLMWLVSEIGRIKPSWRLSAREWALFLSITPLSGVIVGCFSPVLSPIVNAGYVDPYYTKLFDLVPEFWIPKDPKIMEGMFLGGVAVPWGAWMAPYAFWAIYFISFACMMMFGLVLLWERLFLEIEKLPFPYVVSTVELVLHVTGERGRPSIFDVKSFSEFIRTPFWVGFLIGLLIPMPNWLFRLFGLPTMGWIEGTNRSIRYYFVNLYPALEKALPGANLWFFWIDTWFVIAMFAPLDVTLSCVIWYLVCQVIYPVIGRTAGFLPPRSLTAYSYYGIYAGPFKWGMFTSGHSAGGMTIGIALSVIIFGWRYFVNTIKEFIRGVRVETLPPGHLSYRTIWIGAIVSFLVFLSLFVVSGANPGISFLAILFSILIYFLFFIRARAESAVYFDSYMWVDNIWLGLGSALGLAPRWPARSLDIYIPHALTATFTHYARTTTFTGVIMMERRAMAYKLGLNQKQWVISQLLIIFVAAIIGIPVWLWWTYTFGINVNLKMYIYALDRPGRLHNNVVIHFLERTGWGAIKEDWPGEYATWLISGILFTLLLFWLRMRFAWFFLHPVGMVIGGSTYCWTPFLTCLVAWIVKSLILKIGGARLYERVTVPGLVGYTTGLGFMYWIRGLTETFRFLAG